MWSLQRFRSLAGEATARFTVRSAGLSGVIFAPTRTALLASRPLSNRFPLDPWLPRCWAVHWVGSPDGLSKAHGDRPTERRLVEGLMVALVVFVAGVLGVGYLSLPAAIVATEAGAFLTGVLAASLA